MDEQLVRDVLDDVLSVNPYKDKTQAVLGFSIDNEAALATMATLVIDAMRGKGWKFSTACESIGLWRAIFWPSGEEFLSSDVITTAPTFPEAVFKAALAAGRGE